MRGPKPPAIDLTDLERQELEALTRRHSTPQQLALRARIVLAAADGANNCQIAHQLAGSVTLVRRWRERWFARQPAALADLPVADRLTDAPRPGKPVRITDEQVSQITALACETPAGSDRPISQWTSRELADEIKKRGIVDQISGRQARRLLKRGRCTRTASATG
ncbi:MAG: helix-turn-helix domain-containing protein [Chloroflexota bacterium]|nr:helix-turn-helix domain-containing protein [Chloroflexota bacterium]